ncbi:hypothetical protein CR203_06940 [Salipaludibacillus neizhouensis]|uniref:Na+-translocating membrane potential-generating system MpsC domain-containing protein n=2 Tax=Salipaludibacillus neizhouensis TaxID=885475 RepID=A0A3A9K5Y8_9BACI|nr:DUF2294 domain-containing protein [Salipaludibacillus neizhouensis]RKL68464.1 hypothetical protein CR203_06940 [Salipaludibacillus neizhouensis]
MESEISKALTQWEKEYFGRGSVNVKTDIVRNMIIVILKGILTPAEQELAKDQQGVLDIKNMRASLIERGNHQIKGIIHQITREVVESFHTDISVHKGERIIVFMLKENLEKKLT